MLNYPHKPAIDILRNLVASEPGSEGKWFAAAKDAGLFDVAIELANKSPTDPRTLSRASRNFAEKRADFAVSAGMAALYWMARGCGYKITAGDVLEAYSSVLNASSAADVSEAQIKAQLRDVITEENSGNNIVLATLRDTLHAAKFSVLKPFQKFATETEEPIFFQQQDSIDSLD